jgi:hypothetical protein
LGGKPEEFTAFRAKVFDDPALYGDVKQKRNEITGDNCVSFWLSTHEGLHRHWGFKHWASKWGPSRGSHPENLNHQGNTQSNGIHAKFRNANPNQTRANCAKPDKLEPSPGID